MRVQNNNNTWTSVLTLWLYVSGHFDRFSKVDEVAKFLFHSRLAVEDEAQQLKREHRRQPLQADVSHRVLFTPAARAGVLIVAFQLLLLQPVISAYTMIYHSINILFLADMLITTSSLQNRNLEKFIYAFKQRLVSFHVQIELVELWGASRNRLAPIAAAKN